MGVAPEKHDWHRVDGKWVYATSAQILQADKATAEMMVELRKQFDELRDEVQKRSEKKLRESILKLKN